MSDDWDFYALRVDDEPASIYLDLGLAQTAPITSQPYLAYVRVLMRQPRPDGLSSQEEFEALIAVEDSLSDQFKADPKSTYAGRNTSSGNRDFYFYTGDPNSFPAAVEAAMASHPQYQFDVGVREDPDWEAYFQFLHPSPDDLQRILSRRVIDQLRQHGDNLAAPRPINHFAYLPTLEAANHLLDHLRSQGFAVEEPRPEDDRTIRLAFTRADRPDEIGDVVLPIARQISDLDGNYDGWGCEVATEQPGDSSG